MNQRAPKTRSLPRRQQELVEKAPPPKDTEPRSRSVAGPSVELTLISGAVIAGAVLRLLLLDARPLSVEEGTLAAEAYGMVQAQPVESLHQGPFLADGTTLLLAMFGGNDGAARLLSVLFGTVLIAAPYLLRGALGSLPAVLAAWGLAFSPVMLFASRSVGSGIVAITLGMLLWAALDPGIAAISTRRIYLSAVLLGCLLTSGPEGITVAVSLGMAALLTSPRPASILREGRARLAGAAGRNTLLFLVATLVAIGIGFGANLGGFQTVAVDIWVSWIRSFSLATPRGLLLGLLGLYELPVVLLGIVQLVRTLWRRDRTDTLLSLWTMLMLLISMLQTTNIVARVVLPSLPLYLLAARLVAESGVALSWRGAGWRWNLSWLAVLVPIGVGIVLLNRGSTPATDVPVYYLYGEVALVALAGVALSFLLRSRERLALVWALLAILGAGYLLHNSAYLNYRQESLSREPLVGNQVSVYLRGAAEEASYFTSYFSMPLTVDPSLRTGTDWYLRQAKNVQYSSARSDGMLILSVRSGDEAIRDGVDRLPGIFVPGFDARDLTWQGVWRWMVDRDGLVRSNQRDIIVRIPSENW